MEDYIPVGILHSLSGTMSFSESPLVDAALMAFDEINRAGGVLGKQVRPLVEDCASNPQAYALKARRLNRNQGVQCFFGCWTSASRKAVSPVVEAAGALLWYPVQYEGLEQSSHIIYTGSCLNQQIQPAVEWAAHNLGRKWYLVGSDYVFPKTTNRFIRSLSDALGAKVLGESYLPMGAENFERIVRQIKRLKPDVVFNTINGDSNNAFYYHLGRTGVDPDKIPVMAFSIGEVELKDIGRSAIGHYACSSYFQCLDVPENTSFISTFQQRYGFHRVVSDAVCGAYTQPYLWKNLVEKCATFEMAVLKENIAGTTHAGPSGNITIHANHHAFKPALIGRINTDLQFDMVWQSPEWIRPLPFLGLEEFDFPAKTMIQEALAAFPQMIAYPGRLKQEIEKRKRAEQELKTE